MLWYIYSFAQICSLTVTVSQVNDMAHGPLYFLGHLILLLLWVGVRCRALPINIITKTPGPIFTKCSM